MAGRNPTSDNPSLSEADLRAAVAAWIRAVLTSGEYGPLYGAMSRWTKAAGVPASTVGHFVNGQNKSISPRNLAKLEKATTVPLRLD